MRARRWHGKHDVRCDTAPDPIIEHPRDAVIKVSACSICSIDSMYDRVKQAVMLESDRPHVLREMGLTWRMGQTHVNRWTDDLLKRIVQGQIDPPFAITHSVGLEKGPEMYRTFRDKEDGCIKVVLKP